MQRNERKVRQKGGRKRDLASGKLTQKDKEHIIKKRTRKAYNKYIRKHGEPASAEADDDLFFSLEDRERAKFEQQEIKQINKKMALKLNLAANLARKGHDVRYLLKKEKLLSKPKTKRTFVLASPLELLNTALELSLVHQEQLLVFFASEQFRTMMIEEPAGKLTASLQSVLANRKSPLQVRIHMLWQFSSSLHAYIINGGQGDRLSSLKLAIKGYDLLADLMEVWQQSSTSKDTRHERIRKALYNSRKMAKVSLKRYQLSLKAMNVSIIGEDGEEVAVSSTPKDALNAGARGKSPWSAVWAASTEVVAKRKQKAAERAADKAQQESQKYIDADNWDFFQEVDYYY